MPEYRLIEDNRQVVQLCRELAGEPELAVDLEADSLHHYREKVCLVQISTRRATWLIDPLAADDISPLAALLGDQQRLTVLHGGDYDVRSLHRDFGIEVASMFDTMIAAQFCGVQEFGLAALLREHFDLELDKRFQKADWSIRPLTREMADYAAHDTAHLLQLADLLRERLQGLGRAGWVAEECALVAANRMAERGDTPLYLSCKGAGKLRPRNLALLEELLKMRDRVAQELDRPPFKVIPTDALLQLAERGTSDVRYMNDIAGLSAKLLNRYGALLQSALQRGLAVPEQRLPRYPRSKGEPNHGIKKRMASLKTVREALSNRLGLTPGLIAPNWLLERIAEQQPETVEQLRAIQGIRNWQIEVWGVEMLTMLTQERQTT